MLHKYHAKRRFQLPDAANSIENIPNQKSKNQIQTQKTNPTQFPIHSECIPKWRAGWS